MSSRLIFLLTMCLFIWNEVIISFLKAKESFDSRPKSETSGDLSKVESVHL